MEEEEYELEEELRISDSRISKEVSQQPQRKRYNGN